jgi:hypothetical protein
MGVSGSRTNGDSPGRPQAPLQRSRWTVTLQGQLLTVTEGYNYRKSKPPQRSGIHTPFSASSRLRLLKSIATIDWENVGPCLLITLTYPDPLVIRSYQKRSTDRYLFHRYMEKSLGRRIPVLWRTEWKDRLTGEHAGALCPHIHLVAFDVAYVPWQDIRQWWRSVLGWQGYLSTDVRRADAQGAARYTAKYAAKAPSYSLDYVSYLNKLSFGRPWGYFRPAEVPRAEKTVITGLSDVLIDTLRDRVDRVTTREFPYQGGSYTVFGEVAQRLGRWFFDQCLDDGEANG